MSSLACNLLVWTCAVLHSSTQFRQFTAHYSGSGASVMRVEINLPSVSLVLLLLLSLEIVDKDLGVLLRVVVAGDDGVEWKWGT